MSLVFTGSETPILISQDDNPSLHTYGEKMITYLDGYWYVVFTINDGANNTRVLKSSDFTTWEETNFPTDLDYEHPKIYKGNDRIFVLTGQDGVGNGDEMFLHIYYNNTWATHSLPTIPVSLTVYTNNYLVVDSNNDAHIVTNTYSTTTSKRKYFHTRFDTFAESFDSWEEINSSTYYTADINAVCIDYSDNIHIVANHKLTISDSSKNYYTYGNTGSWQTWENITSYIVDSNYVDVISDLNNVIYIVNFGYQTLDVITGNYGSWNSTNIESREDGQYELGSITNDGNVIHIMCFDDYYYPTSNRLLYITNNSGDWVVTEFTNNDLYSYACIYHTDNAIASMVVDLDNYIIYGYYLQDIVMSKHNPMFYRANQMYFNGIVSPNTVFHSTTLRPDFSKTQQQSIVFINNNYYCTFGSSMLSSPYSKYVRVYKSLNGVDWVDINFPNTYQSEFASITYDLNNNIHLICEDVTTHKLNYSCYNITTETWSDIVQINNGYSDCKILVGSENIIHVVSASGDYIYHSYSSNGVNWISEEVFSQTLYDSIDFFGSACIDKNNTIHIVFKYNNYGVSTVLKYCYGTTGDWNIIDVFSTDVLYATMHHDIGVDSNNNIHIVYNKSDGSEVTDNYFYYSVISNNVVLYTKKINVSDEIIINNISIDDDNNIHVCLNIDEFKNRIAYIKYDGSAWGNLIIITESLTYDFEEHSLVYAKNNNLIIFACDTRSPYDVFVYIGISEDVWKRVRKIRNYNTQFRLSKSTKYLNDNTEWGRVSL
jgi:hypothetical protein